MSEARPAKRKGKRFTISLTQVVSDWADEMCDRRGFDNFSAYVADLIRRDKERQEQRDLGADVKDGSYPPHRDEITAIEESPKPPTKKAPVYVIGATKKKK